MEPSKISPNTGNLSMPRGLLSFAPINDSGDMTGEIDLGNCSSFDLTNAVAYKEHSTAHDSVVVLDAKKPSEQKYTGKFAPEERSAENMALFFLGDPDANKTGGKYQAGGHAVAQAIPALYLDRWIDLGKKYIKPGTVVISKASSPIIYDASGQWKDAGLNLLNWIRFDYENGLLMILSTNDALVTDGDDTITIDYHYGAVTLKSFEPRIRAMKGFLRYRGLSEVGPRHSVECWMVQITPDAALGLLKPTDYAGLGYSMDVFYDDDARSHVSQGLPPFFRVQELDLASASFPS